MRFGQRRPIWNQKDFTCPRCERSFQPNKIRIMNTQQSGWVCHGCMLREYEPAYMMYCITCHAPLKEDNQTVNKYGKVVHKNCPKK